MATLSPVTGEAKARLGVAAPFLIEQDYGAYTEEQNAVWSELVRRRLPQLREHACREYLDGFRQIELREDRLPELAAVSALLAENRLAVHAGERLSPGGRIFRDAG